MKVYVRKNTRPSDGRSRRDTVSYQSAQQLGIERKRRGEMSNRQRQAVGQVIVHKLPKPKNLRGTFRGKAMLRLRALWSVPRADIDLWYCGKVEIHSP